MTPFNAMVILLTTLTPTKHDQLTSWLNLINENDRQTINWPMEQLLTNLISEMTLHEYLTILVKLINDY